MLSNDLKISTRTQKSIGMGEVIGGKTECLDDAEVRRVLCCVPSRGYPPLLLALEDGDAKASKKFNEKREEKYS